MKQADSENSCSFIEVMEVVGGKWRGTILFCLSKGPRRFGELLREVTPITQKVLTQELRGLERDGLVSRVHHAEIPPRVVYSVTNLGDSLVTIFALISDWRSNVPAVNEARSNYDARRQASEAGKEMGEGSEANE